MKIVITGNMGYIGPRVVNQLRRSYPGAQLIGIDTGYFAHCLTATDYLPECGLDIQYFHDVRSVNADMLRGVDAIVHLAAISNDPMGNAYEEVTEEINYKASVALAKLARQCGVASFVFASSCSVYGFAEGGPRNENSEVNPLTAYARSKVFTENELQSLASDDFKVTCLRFATACGMSKRLRLDLVLNDFVACAVTSGKITILSDGTPWRPLICVDDMARAIDWAIQRNPEQGGSFLAVNAGSNQWNYQVKDLAQAVADIIPGVDISINKDAQPDKRSYQVSFDRFAELAPDYQPQVDLHTAIKALYDGLTKMELKDADFRNSDLMRLKVLTRLRNEGLLTEQLEWQTS
ncbi:MAG: NAD-dependent epimerase/dehydratase family protein [Gammaproteobacteria bacterium]